MRPPLHPPVGQRIRLTVIATGAQLVAVVDADERDELLLREPVHLDGSSADALEPDAAVVVGWTSAYGRHELDCSLDAVTEDDRVPLWRLSVDGTARTTQLRRFTRAEDSLGADLVRGARSWRAVVADLSEGGARAVVVETQQLSAGDQVVLRISVDTDDLHLPACVLEVTALPDGQSQLRLQFGEIGRAADVVRRRVLAQQRRARSVVV